MALKPGGMDVTTCVAGYYSLWYDRVPHQCVDRRDVNELLHRFPSCGREHQQNTIAAPTGEESAVWGKL